MHDDRASARAGIEDRLRRLLAWVLPALLLAGVATAAVGVAGQTGPTDPTSATFPREPGATWTYANRTDGAATGHDVVQVVGTAQLSEQVVDVLETRWDDFLGRGAPFVSRRYVSSAGSRVLDHGTRSGDTYTAIEPPMPLLDLTGSSSWTGTVEGNAATAELTGGGREDLEVAGRPYASCLHQRQDVTVSGDTGYTSALDSWSCPEVGTVRTLEVFVQGDTTIRLERDLVAFSTREHSFRTPQAPAVVAVGIASTTPSVGSTADLGSGRANAVDGALDLSSYAWTTRMLAEPSFPPLALGRSRMLLVDEKGVVTSTDVRSGEIGWRLRVRPPVPVPPVVVDGTVFVADGAKGLLALDGETGETRWSTAFDDVPSTAPVVVDGVLTVAFEDRTLRGLSVEDGRTTWERDTTGRIVQPLATDGRLVHVADTNGLLSAHRPADGDTAWEVDLGAAPTGGPSVAGGLLVVADGQGFVQALDADDGDVRWQEYREATVSEQLAVTPEAVALVLDGRELEVLDATSGGSRWTARTGEVGVPPVVVGDALAVVERSGGVSSYSLDDGRRSARRQPGADPGDAVEGSVAMGWVDDTLVVPLSHRVAGGGTLVSFPTAAKRSADGVRLSRTLQPLPAPPLVPPSGTLDDFVYAAAGSAVWRVTGGAAADQPLASGPSSFFALLAGDRVLHQGEDGLQVSEPDSGEVLWTAPMAPASPGVAPALAGDAVVVPLQGVGLTAYELDGRLRWAQDVPDPGAPNAATPMALPDGDVVYAGGALARYDGATGAQLWSAGDLDVFAPLAADEDTVYAAGFEADAGVLLAVDLETGARRWSVPVQAAALQGPVAGGGCVCLVDARSVVHGFDRATGDTRWSAALDGGPGGMPVVIGDALVVGTKGDSEIIGPANHRVVAFAADSGTFLGGRELAGNDFGVAGFGRLGDRAFAPSFDLGLVAELLSLETS